MNKLTCQYLGFMLLFNCKSGTFERMTTYQKYAWENLILLCGTYQQCDNHVISLEMNVQILGERDVSDKVLKPPSQQQFRSWGVSMNSFCHTSQPNWNVPVHLWHKTSENKCALKRGIKTFPMSLISHSTLVKYGDSLLQCMISPIGKG